MKRIEILGVPFDAVTREEALERLLFFLKTTQNHLVITPNPEGVMLARRDADFRRVLQRADLMLADGIGILLAARYLKLPLPERVPGCDTATALIEAAEKAGFTVYLLGSAPGVARKAVVKLEERFPNLQIAGARDGFFNQKAETLIVDEIKSLNPDILLVGMGMPRQEFFAAAHLEALPCKITLCVGGSIDIMAGEVRRAPKILRRMGLEWLYRLCKQPSRWRRMLDLPRFGWAVLTGNISKKIR